MISIKTIHNPIYFGYALQTVASASGIVLIPTYLNTKSINDKSFNPNFLIFKACKDGEQDAFCYVVFRTKREVEDSFSGFSSVAIIDKMGFNPDMPVYKKHISDFNDTIEGLNMFCKDIVAFLMTKKI